MEPTRTTRWPQPFAGLRGIRWADVPREVSAGITLAALIIPLNIGYAQVAGLPPVVGLYAAIIPLVVFALFTTFAPCRWQPGCLHRRAGGSSPVGLRRARGPASRPVCRGVGRDVRSVVLRLLVLPAGVSRQFPLAGRAGRLHIRPGHRGLHQPGQEDPGRLGWKRGRKSWRLPIRSRTPWPVRWTPRATSWRCWPC